MNYYVYKIYFEDEPLKLYIGITNNPKSRLKYHLTPSKLIPNTHKNNWLKQKIAKGLEPKLEIIAEEFTEENIFQAEIEFIKIYKEHGYILTNSTDGGEGILNPSSETRQKLSKAAKGRKLNLTDEERIRRSDAIKGNDKMIAKGKKPMLGKNHSEDTKVRISNATRGELNPFFGRNHSPQTRAFLSSIRSKVYAVTHPSGKIEIVKNLKEFCSTHGLTYTYFSKCIKSGRACKGYFGVINE